MHVISLTKDQNKGCIQRNHPKYMFLEEKYDHWKTCKPLIWKRDRGFLDCMHDRKISKYSAKKCDGSLENFHPHTISNIKITSNI